MAKSQQIHIELSKKQKKSTFIKVIVNTDRTGNNVHYNYTIKTILN